jgi:hypothetical protein
MFALQSARRKGVARAMIAAFADRSGSAHGLKQLSMPPKTF